MRPPFAASSHPNLNEKIRQKGPIEDCTLEIEFLDPEVHAPDFTIWLAIYELFSTHSHVKRRRSDSIFRPG
jgi:hypothetical protein